MNINLKNLSGENMTRPSKNEYAEFYHKYVTLVPNGEIIDIMQKQSVQFCEFLAKVPEAKGEYRYAKGKWNIKEVIAHITDVEIAFNYRAWRFSHKDKQELAGFEQDDYIKNIDLKNYTLSDMVEQFYNVRIASISNFKLMNEKMWKNKGIASGNSVSVKGCAYIMAGHVMHHTKILHTKYLS